MSHSTRLAPPRVGIINLMPRAEQYERSLLGALHASGVAFQPVFVRLRTHVYQSSDPLHIARAYRPMREVWSEAALDALLITGAPVEELEWQAVSYWSELCEIIDFAREHVPSTLGLCWGGLALGQRLGIEKRSYERKLFGVFPLERLVPEHPVLGHPGEPLSCPQSRHSGIVDAHFERASARGVVRGLAAAPDGDVSIFESADGRFLAHLGHPEYEPQRLVFEYERDRAAARSDVGPPLGFDVSDPQCSWRPHQRSFFGGWLASVSRAAP